MLAAMSYPYPDLVSSGPGMDMQPSLLNHDFRGLNNIPEYPPPPPPPGPSEPSRDGGHHTPASSTVTNSKMKGSMSTPNVRGPASMDDAASAEKRRNKLGYHRTSVACSEFAERRTVRRGVGPLRMLTAPFFS